MFKVFFKNKKNLLIICLNICSFNLIFAQSIQEKTSILNIDLMQNLREIKPMAMNFKCSPFPACLENIDKSNKIENQTIEKANDDTKDVNINKNYVKEFNEMSRMYEEANALNFQKKPLEAFIIYSKLQVRIDEFLDSMSVFYIARTEDMIKGALSKKRPSDPDDKLLYEAFIDYGPNSYRRKVMEKPREVPEKKRIYNSKERHWALNKYLMEQNIKNAYEYLGSAKEAREVAIKIIPEVKPRYKDTEVEVGNTPNEKVENDDKHKEKPLQNKESVKEKPNEKKENINEKTTASNSTKRVEDTDKTNPKYYRQLDYRDYKKRIDFFLRSIAYCRISKVNSGSLFMLKYPYDNYAIHNPFGLTEKGLSEAPHIPEIEGVSMILSDNPNVVLKNYNPVYDLRIPVQFRRDLSDVKKEVFEDQIDTIIKLKYNRTKPDSFKVNSSSTQKNK